MMIGLVIMNVYRRQNKDGKPIKPKIIHERIDAAISRARSVAVRCARARLLRGPTPQQS